MDVEKKEICFKNIYSTLILLLFACTSASAEEYIITAAYTRPGAAGAPQLDAAKVIAADSERAAVKSYKKNLLDAYPDYEIQILQVCTKDHSICTNYKHEAHKGWDAKLND